MYTCYVTGHTRVDAIADKACGPRGPRCIIWQANYACTCRKRFHEVSSSSLPSSLGRGDEGDVKFSLDRAT